MSAAASLDAAGVRPVRLPATEAARAALAARMRGAIDAAEVQGGDRGAIGCARLLAALVEHCPRHYPTVAIRGERRAAAAPAVPVPVPPAPADVAEPQAVAPAAAPEGEPSDAAVAALAADLEAHRRRLDTVAVVRDARADRLGEQRRRGGDGAAIGATLAEIRAERDAARAELAASQLRLAAAEAEATTLAARVVALRTEVVHLRVRIADLEGARGGVVEPEGATASVSRVIREAARHFGCALREVRPDDSSLAVRYQRVVDARHVAMWVIYHRANRPVLSTTVIGRFFGGFDHSTVINALRRVSGDLARGGPLGEAATAIAAAAGVDLDIGRTAAAPSGRRS